MLRLKSFIMAVKAYAYVRCEYNMGSITLTWRDNNKIGSIMASKRVKDGLIILSQVKCRLKEIVVLMAARKGIIMIHVSSYMGTN